MSIIRDRKSLQLWLNESPTAEDFVSILIPVFARWFTMGEARGGDMSDSSTFLQLFLKLLRLVMRG